jgi:hypothetical protein
LGNNQIDGLKLKKQSSSYNNASLDEENYVNHFWTPLGKHFEDKSVCNFDKPQSLVNFVFHQVMESMINPFFECDIKFNMQTKRLLAELSLISFSNQTYGHLATCKILKNMNKGRTRTFDLIDKLKAKVFTIAKPEVDIQDEKVTLLERLEEKMK